MKPNLKFISYKLKPFDHEAPYYIYNYTDLINKIKRGN
jgi:hypothetical protein